MSKLHELLAVENNLEGLYSKIVEETRTTFTKHPERYFGQTQRVENFDENAPEESDSHKQMDDTVKEKLAYTEKHIIRYFDAVLQKEATNQTAYADIIIDGVTIASSVPATFLLGLEKKLKKVRDNIYAVAPTLQLGVKWESDTSMGQGVYIKTYPDEKFRTKKVMKNHVVAKATKEHPEQVNVYNEDEKTAKIITSTWCGMITSSEKAAYLGKIDKLIQAVKKARQRANTTKVVNSTIGKELFAFINS